MTTAQVIGCIVAISLAVFALGIIIGLWVHVWAIEESIRDQEGMGNE